MIWPAVSERGNNFIYLASLARNAVCVILLMSDVIMRSRGKMQLPHLSLNERGMLWHLVSATLFDLVNIVLSFFDLVLLDSITK